LSDDFELSGITPEMARRMLAGSSAAGNRKSAESKAGGAKKAPRTAGLAGSSLQRNGPARTRTNRPSSADGKGAETAGADSFSDDDEPPGLVSEDEEEGEGEQLRCCAAVLCIVCLLQFSPSMPLWMDLRQAILPLW
jgi:hypothetical protein